MIENPGVKAMWKRVQL